MSRRKYFKKVFLCRSCNNEFKDTGNDRCIFCFSKNLSIVKYYFKKKRILNQHTSKTRLCFCYSCKNESEYNKNLGLYKCPYCLNISLCFYTLSNIESIKEAFPDTYMRELKFFRKLKTGKIKWSNDRMTKRWLDFLKRKSQTEWISF